MANFFGSQYRMEAFLILGLRWLELKDVPGLFVVKNIDVSLALYTATFSWAWNSIGTRCNPG